MKALLTTAFLASALFTSQAFAGGLSDFSTQSVEATLAADHVTSTQVFISVDSPLSDLGTSVEAQLSNDNHSTVNTRSYNFLAGLDVPAQSQETLL
ncbi:hypothetical protein [Neptunomonas japonica]|uniref:hypothetical protein n=1 Tax=Neptunomonas japonica TaxID=417574 RepID=UPI000408A4BB|nr:hypothetical protein [Neptunomonas japonica]